MIKVQESIIAACGQMQPVFGDTPRNLDKIAALTETAGADLIVFPELATSGYEFINRREALDLSLDIKDGVEIEGLRQLARDTNCHIVLGLPERSGDRIFNSSVLVESCGEITIYRKIHLFDREKAIFTPGDEVPKVAETALGKIGMMICFDWIFPETARLMAVRGMQILCHPANLVLSFCQRAMFARSVENGIFSLTCNRIGCESRADRTLAFTGQSQILSPRGEMLAQASPSAEEIIKTEFKPVDADNKRFTDANDIIRDRRPEFYKELINL
ncbi:MAG: nitrilase-related carbon-nitrogen hydrolase [Calditrichota bacterium]